MKGTIQAGFVNPASLEWTRANYGISALSVHERAISMLRAQEQDTPSMKLNVNGGAYLYNGVMHLFIGEESPEFTAPAEGTRLDILYLAGESGELAIQEGTAAVAITDPLELPTLPSGAIPLVAVHLAAGQETITESDLYDLRAFVMGWAMPDHDHTGDVGDGGKLEADEALKATGITDEYVLTATGSNTVEWKYPLGTFVAGYYSSTSWDGDAKDGASGTIDLSAVFGLPAGIKAVAVRLSIKDETAGVYASLSQDSSPTTFGVVTRTQVANQYVDVAGVVPCDANGDIYFDQGGELDAVYLYITGYFR